MINNNNNGDTNTIGVQVSIIATIALITSASNETTSMIAPNAISSIPPLNGKTYGAAQ